jgi:hypothetical protein
MQMRRCYMEENGAETYCDDCIEDTVEECLIPVMECGIVEDKLEWLQENEKQNYNRLAEMVITNMNDTPHSLKRKRDDADTETTLQDHQENMITRLFAEEDEYQINTDECDQLKYQNYETLENMFEKFYPESV